MSFTRDALREILSLDPSDTFEVELELPLVRPGQRAYAEAAVPLETLLQTQPWKTIDGLPPGLRVDRMATHSVVAVGADEATLLTGRSGYLDDFLLLDAQQDGAVALAVAGGQEYAVVAWPDGIAVHRLVRVQPAPWSPPARDLGARPTREEIAAGWSVPDGLSRRVDRLMASAGPLSSIAALGTLARLWEASDASERASALAAPHTTPAGRLRLWASVRTESQLAAIVDWLSVEVVQLTADLEQLAAIAAEDPLSASALALHIVSDRDALESVWFTATLAGHGDAIGRMLAAFDREAETHLSILALAEPPDEMRSWLLAVSWQQPDAWWGALGESC